LRNRLSKGREVTLADVAEYAGVSASTASRALNGRGELSDETRAAVIAAAGVLQFEPSLLARSLRTRTTWTVGFVVPDVSSPFYAAALKGAQAALEESGYRVLLMDSGQGVDGELAALRTLLNHQIDGLLLSTVGIPAERFEELVARRGTPCVFFDSVLPGAGEGSVLLENSDGIDRLVDHLVSHGHRRIGLLAGSREESSGRQRLDAFHAAMVRHGLDVPDDYVRGDRWSTAAGCRAALQLLDAEPRPTALVASSVELALGAMFACRERELQIPGDLALATFDDAYFAELLEPPLTAVGYDPMEVGRNAATLLVEAMGEAPTDRRDLTVPVTLVARRSCGCTG
jgi:LacI family transcriptional regulator